MNLQQLEYIIALDNHRHFVQAADQCCVTQPTLSMMVKKLEEELDVKIFDRNRQPVTPTDIGVQIINQARTVLKEANRIQEIVKTFNGVMNGDLRVGVIPTIAPYILPAIVPAFTQKYPEVNLQVSEMITTRIATELRNGGIDAGIVATGTNESSFQEIPLYREKFYVYLSEDNGLYDKEYIVAEDIRGDELWLLEEGHCLSDQIRKFCELRKSQLAKLFTFRSGSIETLIRMVERNGGVTILPELAARELPAEKKKFLRDFHEPVPFREVRIVTNREEVKARLVEALHAEVKTQTDVLLAGEVV
jgi:LysR family hydrogen peroxide-inducible transcriptional activator